MERIYFFSYSLLALLLLLLAIGKLSTKLVSVTIRIPTLQYSLTTITDLYLSFTDNFSIKLKENHISVFSDDETYYQTIISSATHQKKQMRLFYSILKE